MRQSYLKELLLHIKTCAKTEHLKRPRGAIQNVRRLREKAGGCPKAYDSVLGAGGTRPKRKYAFRRIFTKDCCFPSLYSASFSSCGHYLRQYLGRSANAMLPKSFHTYQLAFFREYVALTSLVFRS